MSWLDLPTREWVPCSVPPSMVNASTTYPPGTTGYGTGPNCKHQRFSYAPDIDRMLMYGGDWTGGGPAAGSFRQEILTYDIRRRVAGEADWANWRLDVPWCGVNAQLRSSLPDECALAWDSTRNLFWHAAGWEVSPPHHQACGNPNMVQRLLQYHPSTRTWSNPGAAFRDPGTALAGTPNQLGQNPRHCVYYPPSDELIFVTQAGGPGNVALHMSCSTGAYRVFPVPTDYKDQAYINRAQTIHEQLALDVEGRWIYVIDTYQKEHPDPNQRHRLFRYSPYYKGMESLGYIPMPTSGPNPLTNFGATSPFRIASTPLTQHVGQITYPYYALPFDSTCLMWDSVNQVLLWPASQNEGRPLLMIYHPDPTGGKAGTWEIDPMRRPEGQVIFGSNGSFVPELNALVIYGGFGGAASEIFIAAKAAGWTGTAPTMSTFWLYRYGTGSAPIPTPRATIGAITRSSP